MMPEDRTKPLWRQSLTTSLPLCLGSGALLVLVFPKFDFWLLCPVALVPLLLAVIRERSGRRRFLWGFLSGCVFFAGTCYWIYDVMRNYGGLGVTASAGVFGLFFLVLAVYWGVFGWLAGYLWTVPWGPPAIPLVWVAIEYARAHLLTGFPWLLLGYALTGYFRIAHLARWTGVYGLSFLVVAVNVALVWLFRRRGMWPAINLGAVAAVVLLLVATVPREQFAENHRAYLVQTDIPEQVAYEPWTASSQRALLTRLEALTIAAVAGHRSLAAQRQNPSLVIWPETPAPFYFGDHSFSRVYAERIARETHSYFLMGIVGYVPGSDGTKPLNSEVLLNPQGGVVSQYDKIHLVPFGEYVPLKRWLRFAGKLTAEVSDFVPGDRYVVSQLPGGSMAGVICYEAIFPDLVRRFVKAGAEVLVNTSNDGWYGSSAARYQHLLMARMRAIENDRYLLRATNTGITAIIRPDGRLGSRLAPDRPGVLAGQWAFLNRQTFYSRHGDWFAIATCIGSVLSLLAVMVVSRRTRARQDQETACGAVSNAASR